MLNKISYIQALVEKLNKANIAYYNSGTPIITDDLWDTYFKELQTLEQETGYILTNSPTQYVGYQTVDVVKKVSHVSPMLSLNKVHTVEEIKKFMNEEICLCSLKMDGLTIRATYKDGMLDRLETRGNGIVGTDITYHKNSFVNIPLKIKEKGTYVIDGECIIKTDDFETINENSPQKFENPRNLAAGTLSNQDTSISAKRFLRFIAWNVIKGERLTNSFSQNLQDAENLGFTVVPFQMIYSGSDLNKILDNVKKIASNYCYPIDGAVISIDDRAKGRSLGKTEHHFNHSIAYKYEDEVYPTILRDIEWSMGTEKLTPVAIFDPIRIDGSTVERASLHNITYLKKLKLGIGDTITIFKANAIIPQVKENLTQSDSYKIPLVCPICGSPTSVKYDGICEELCCSNLTCEGKLLSRCIKFVSKECMDIDGLSGATLEKFIQLNYITHPFDIYTKLPTFKDEIMKLDGFGKTSTINLFQAIENSKNILLDHFINAMNIPLVGKATSKLIAKQCNYDIDTFMHLLEDKFNWHTIDTIGLETNRSIYNWYQDNQMQIKDFIKILSFEKVTENINTNILNGKAICVTGKLIYYPNRNELISDIEKFGGTVCTGVSKKTDYLLTNDTESGSSKNKKAKELNIPVITEEDFLKIIKKEK